MFKTQTRTVVTKSSAIDALVYFLLTTMSWKWIVPSVVAVLVALLYQNQRTDTPQQQYEHALYVIGDLHGDVHCARHWVNRTGLMDERFQEWLDPTSSLLFLGDYIDKGPTSKQCLQFVKSLTDMFPQHVTAILGNHEVELLRDRDVSHKAWGKGSFFQLSYAAAHPGEYLNYIDNVTREDEIVVEALYKASLEVYSKNKHNEVFLLPDELEILQFIPSDLRELVKDRLTIYQEKYLNAYRTGTELGTWLEERPIVVLKSGALFVHGGVSAKAARYLKQQDGIDHLNNLWKQHATEEKLNAFLDTTTEGQVLYEMLTFRGNHNVQACQYLPQLLPPGATRLGVGHTPNYNVKSMCNGKLMALDSSLGRYFRNSGNEYCRGDKVQQSSNGKYVCRKMNSECKGQIMRIRNDQVEVIE